MGAVLDHLDQRDQEYSFNPAIVCPSSSSLICQSISGAGSLNLASSSFLASY